MDKMNTQSSQKILSHGLFLGLAISSRFLLNFQDGTWAEVLSFILLFSMYSGLIFWLREYQKSLPDNKISLKQIFGFTFKLFLIGAALSSFIKYCFFAYIKPSEFAIFVEQQEMKLNLYKEYLHEGLITAVKEKNTIFIDGYKNNIQNFPFLKSIAISIYYLPVVTFFLNLLGGVILSWFVWPLFKYNQQKQNPIN